MPFNTAIRWVHGFITLALLILVVGCWFMHSDNASYAEEELQHTYKLNNQLWLYMTENRHGGATVPIIYRYYLGKEIKGSEREIVKHLNADMLFLSGTGTISAIHADNENRVEVTYSGEVFSLSRKVYYQNADQTMTAHINYQIR